MRKFIELINKIRQDRCAHFLIGLLLTWIIYTIYYAITHILWDTLVVTEVAILLVSVWKAIIDDEFDVKDFISTILGNFMALLMIFIDKIA